MTEKSEKVNESQIDFGKQSMWYHPRDIGVSFCPFCGSGKIEKWNSWVTFDVVYRCTSCGNSYNVGKVEYMSTPKERVKE